MKTLTLQRDTQNTICTLGSIKDETETLVVPATLELPWLDNKHDMSCIPAGTYSCEYTDHPKHGWVYQVMNVPDRDEILLHIGNFPHDTEGCILLGSARGADSISGSTTAFHAFMTYLEDVVQFAFVVLDVPSFGGAQ